ncbi:MAG: PDZ domain-containing protein [Deltaproteobacteria bacterium]|nr:PDZ domain-containing protein [Deltaproteobacteria bacterium]
MTDRRSAALVLVAAAACAPDLDDKIADLPLSETSRAALGRMRFARLRNGDRVAAGDLVACGPQDRVTLGFSRRLVEAYLGRDGAWAIPELFSSQSKDEVLLEVPAGQILRLALPRGLGGEVGHPDGWARVVVGDPLVSSDMRYVEWLFETGELFAVPRPAPVATAPPAVEPPAPWRLGVEVFPRMGPRGGVVISRVLPASPAESVGLLPGDRILAVNDARVDSLMDLKAAVAAARPPTATLEVRKKNAEKSMTVTLDLNAPPANATHGAPRR